MTISTTSVNTDPENAITVCALYKFVRLDTFETLREPLINKMVSVEVKGTLLLAAEGINCLLYTSPSPRDATLSRMPSSA